MNTIRIDEKIVNNKLHKLGFDTNQIRNITNKKD